MTTSKPDVTGGERGLTGELRKARLAQAAHFDALRDIRDAQTLRLTVLRDEVAAMVAALPERERVFDAALVADYPARLWLDEVSFVAMEPDPRTFRLTRHAASGPETVHETADRAEMVAKIREYAAHRLIERERQPARAANGNGRGLTPVALAWITGFVFGVLGLLTVGILLGKINL